MFRLIYNFLFNTKHRTLTAKVIFLSAVARIRIIICKGNRLYKHLGNYGKESGYDIPDENTRKYISQIVIRIVRVTQRLPWESKCLVQAMIAQRLLRDKDIPSTLYLGVGRDNEDKHMVAHAWLRCGPYYVTGGNGEGFGMVATFTMGTGE